MSETEISGNPRVALLGVPVEIGASQAGTLMGPAALRTAGIARVLEQLGLDVEDHGDLTIDGSPSAERRARPPMPDIMTRSRPGFDRSANAPGCSLVPAPFRSSWEAITALSMGSVNGVARYWQDRGRPLFLLWLDAHADYNTPETTLTGNMHGMSAAFLCGEPGLDHLLGEQPRVPVGPDRLDLFGIRSIDPLEKNLIRDRRIAIADMRAIDEFGVGVLIRRVIERVRAQQRRPACQLRCRFSGPGDCAGCRHDGAGWRDLSRSPPHHGAAARFGAGAISRHRRTQPVSR